MKKALSLSATLPVDKPYKLLVKGYLAGPVVAAGILPPQFTYFLLMNYICDSDLILR